MRVTQSVIVNIFIMRNNNNSVNSCRTGAISSSGERGYLGSNIRSEFGRSFYVSVFDKFRHDDNDNDLRRRQDLPLGKQRESNERM